MSKTKVGLVGCGAIGSYLAKALCREFSEKAELAFLCDADPERAVRLKKVLDRDVQIVDLEKLIQRSDLVIEAASAAVSGFIAKSTLSQGKHALVMSVGGLLGMDWKQLSKKEGALLLIPSGALGGIDGLLAAAEGEIHKVKLITRKPAAALADAPYFQRRKFPALSPVGETTVFRGTAEEVVKGFPQNINVAALLSLAGIGPEKTEVEIRTSPDQELNQHEVLVQAASGEIRAITTNIPAPDNPKTSQLAAYAAVACLRKFFASVKLGT